MELWIKMKSGLWGDQELEGDSDFWENKGPVWDWRSLKRLALCAIWWLRILKGWGFSKNQDLGGAVTRFEDVSSLTKTALFYTLWLRILEEWWFWSSEDQEQEQGRDGRIWGVWIRYLGGAGTRLEDRGSLKKAK
jgi:hypothetical protein